MLARRRFKAIKPSLSLLGFTHGLWLNWTARRDELAVYVICRHLQLISCVVDRIAELV